MVKRKIKRRRIFLSNRFIETCRMVLLFPFSIFIATKHKNSFTHLRLCNCLLAVPYEVVLFTFSLTQCITRQKPRSSSVTCQDFGKAGSQPWFMVLKTSSTVFKIGSKHRCDVVTYLCGFSLKTFHLLIPVLAIWRR